MGAINYATAQAVPTMVEPVQACVFTSNKTPNRAGRINIAHLLGWQAHPSACLCQGYYQPDVITPLEDVDQIQINADNVSFYTIGRSKLKGHVEVRQMQRVVNAQTATIYRDAKTNQVTQIELYEQVRYLEPGRLMLAKKAVINPNDKSGHVEQAIYRFDTQRAGATLPAWGRANWIERLANQDYILRNVTYSTCAPTDRAWEIEASEITLDNVNATGVARNARLRVGDLPVFYSPYLSFPTSNARKSGFLMPLTGYSNVGGFDLALPYYWNIAPNYDATFTPHMYTRRGVMLGGDFRFLTDQSAGMIGGNFLPNDAAFNEFLLKNKDQYPILRGISSDRWSFLLHENTQFNPNLQMHINYQQVSDAYYLQDFSTNLAISTENQLLRQGDLTYTTDHWLFSGALQSYQTLHPINQSEVSNIYERLPQLLAQGMYADLPFHANASLLGQFDYFRWPVNDATQPQGPRYHLNPILALPQIKPWGYITPEVQLVENNYNLTYGSPTSGGFINQGQSFNRAIPRYSIDSGLSFERSTGLGGHAFTQTFEPRLYYLNVPYQNQSAFPAFDSAYMIFNTDQLFRNNRFSGFDRIGDANQMAYAATSRWISAETGREKASFSIGQIRYFADRQVQLCYNKSGQCTDTSLFLGYLSPIASSSPIASKAVYELNSAWVASGDYVWDPFTHATNNGYLNLHYQPAPNRILGFGYNYLVNGNIIETPNVGIQNNALHQATASYAWPLNEQWSSLGVYSYNISEGYSMMTFFGLQYDSCCWAMRLLGGRTFKSLTPDALTPQYNNNVYFQVLLKGLGSVATSDPASTIQSYLPGYANIFQH
ncbi:LPS assembly protein LptD [bacterium]|nr:LPS assembly protein LptD [bacterium]